MAVSANRLELLQIVDAVAREKSIDRSIVLASMEDAMQKAARSRYGQETEVRTEINPKTGEIRFSRLLLVVDQVENDATQITLSEAQKKNPSAQIGDWIAEFAAAVRLRPHPRPGLQAGAGAEDPRGRARQAVRSVQGPHRRDHQRLRSSASNTATSSSTSAGPAARRWSGATN